MRATRLAPGFLTALVALGCGKSTAQNAAAPPAGVASVVAGDAGAGAPAAGDDAGLAPMDAREAAQWAAAKDGDPEELARLAELEGCEGLRERGEAEELRVTAARAMQFCRDFSELPWLAQLAAGKDDAAATAALESAVELAARPRRALDPDDADELHAGCAALLTLARDAERPRARRVLAIRALRMLADRGCAKRAEIPTDLDAH